MNSHEMLPKTEMNCPAGLEVLVLGGGCFWCTEAVFLRLNGVVQVISGYAGGLVERPSYQQICSGTTGHAEVIQVIFDPTKINLSELLAVFWATHDPTTLNRQGADAGPQYRSAIFYLSEAQEKQASEMMEKLDQSNQFSAPIVTEITAFSNFYPAENYHQNYYTLNEGQPYCQYVVRPKVEKLQRLFEDKLKP
jgi:peptide-methionine (S)-S-oxide reductase